MGYYSQLGQDRFLNEIVFKNKKNGTFVDIGAHDGKTISNSLFFEELGWEGICIEPLPHIFEQLQKNRKCICENYAISDTESKADFLLIHGYAEMLSGLLSEYNQMHLGRVDGEIHHYGGSKQVISVNTLRLQTLLDRYNINCVDFLSIDTEGSELKILNSIDYSKTRIDYIVVENNYNDNMIRDFMTSKNFELFKKIEIDDIYINKKL